MSQSRDFFLNLCGFTNHHAIAELPDLQAAGTESPTHRPMLGGRLFAVHPACLFSLVCPVSPKLTDLGLQQQALSFTSPHLHHTLSRLFPLPSTSLLSSFCPLPSSPPENSNVKAPSSGLPGPAPSPCHEPSGTGYTGNCLFTWASYPTGWESIEFWVPRPNPGTSLEEVRT